MSADILSDGTATSTRIAPYAPHIGAVFAVFAGSFGAIMYFTGAQYFEARAIAFGLAGGLADYSFQRTVSTGFALFATSSASFLAGLASLAVMVTGALTAKVLYSDRVLDYVEKRATFRAHRAATQLAICMALATLALLFLGIGSVAGNASAEKAMREVRGDCETCREFRSSTQRILGKAVLQSETLLIVAHKDGLSTFQLSEPLEIKPNSSALPKK